jgi:tRNA G18 (ribose-2'-O)-methylase SpoU
MYTKSKFLTFTGRNMLRKIAVELDTAQRALSGSDIQPGVVRGGLDRAASYLHFAASHERVRDFCAEQRAAVLAILERLGSVGEVDAPKTVFALINAVYHAVAERAGMPVGEQHFCIRVHDNPERDAQRFPCIAIADNIRSAFNMGTIFRTADGFGIESVVLTGISPGPENAKVCKTAMGSEAYQPWSRESSLLDAMSAMAPRHIYALETVEHSVSLYDLEFAFPMAVVLGNEEFGIVEDALDAADTIVHIPMYGIKNSFNVGVSFGMVMCEARRQWEARTTKAGMQI